MALKFSCADYTFPLLSLLQRLSLIQLLGFQYVDLGLFARSSQMSPERLLAMPSDFTKHLKHDLDKNGLSVSDIFLQIGETPADFAVNDPSSLVRERNRTVFHYALDLCANLGCRHLSGLPGVRHPEIEKTRDDDCAVAETAWRMEMSSLAGLQYSIEPHIGSICPDVDSTLTFLKAVPRLTLTLDYGHFIAAGQLLETVHSLVPFASHVHVRGGAESHLQTSVKENQIDFEGILERLANRSYRGFLALEYVWTDWQGCNRTDNVSETLLLREHLSRFNVDSPEAMNV
ncbi:MAG: TIM barrel protein [Acidobacteriaceae bacterium]